MSEIYKPRIVSAERLDGGVIISFDNGRTAIYSASVLYKSIGEANEVNDLEVEGSST